MSERDFYFMHLPQIAELIIDCQQMTPKSYDKWKEETLASIPDESIGFMKKVFVITDKYSGHKMSA